MGLEELNKIFLHAVSNGWANKSYLQGWDFEGKTYNETYEIFKNMEITKQVYEGVTPSKTTIRVDTKCASHRRKQKGGEPASPTNPEKGCAGKRKKKHAGHTSNRPTGEKTCLLHGPGHSSEECRVLKYYSKKYAAQRPNKGI